MRKILALAVRFGCFAARAYNDFCLSLKSFALDSKFYTSILSDKGVFQAIQSDRSRILIWAVSLAR